jgi:hypothetical protein
MVIDINFLKDKLSKDEVFPFLYKVTLHHPDKPVEYIYAKGFTDIVKHYEDSNQYVLIKSIEKLPNEELVITKQGFSDIVKTRGNIFDYFIAETAISNHYEKSENKIQFLTDIINNMKSSAINSLYNYIEQTEINTQRDYIFDDRFYTWRIVNETTFIPLLCIKDTQTGLFYTRNYETILEQPLTWVMDNDIINNYNEVFEKTMIKPEYLVTDETMLAKVNKIHNWIPLHLTIFKYL